MLPEFPSAARVSDYLCDLEYLFSRMNVGSYGPTEPHLWLVSKIPTRTWGDCRTTSERKSKTHTYDDLVDLLIELALAPICRDSSRDTLVEVASLPLNVVKGKGPKIPLTPTGVVLKSGATWSNVKQVHPHSSTVSLSMTRGDSDCHHRSGCVLQLKRQQHTKDGKTVTHQDHFRCTITCGYCGKRRHYEDECHIKRRESDKHKRQEAERQKAQTPSRTPQNGDKGGEGGGKGGGKGGTINPLRRSSAPAISPCPADVDAKRRPQGDNASPQGSNCKKGRLAWMANSLMAAGVDVKLPAEK